MESEDVDSRVLAIEACTETLVAVGKHDLLIETLQREMREEMLTIVSEAKASKIKLSALECARRKMDAWLRLLEMVRAQRASNLRFQAEYERAHIGYVAAEYVAGYVAGYVAAEYERAHIDEQQRAPILALWAFPMEPAE
eukprot:6495472-Prymnesium_polylepis.1